MENQLQIIVRDSGLEKTKAKYMLDNFQCYFEIADEWAKKSKTLVVTNADQKAEMQMARTGRLFLREKRIDVEKSRKILKEESLRESRAIDGIANVLKALIIPIELYLEHQEKFVEMQEEKKRELLRIEAEKKIEEEEIAKAKAEAEERERIRQENERLKIEAKKRERKAEAERKKHEATLAKERAEAEAKRKILEEKAMQERKEAEKKLFEERKKAHEENQKAEIKRKALEEKVRKEREKAQAKADKERKEKERLAEILKNQIICPKCGHKFQLKKEK